MLTGIAAPVVERQRDEGRREGDDRCRGGGIACPTESCHAVADEQPVDRKHQGKPEEDRSVERTVVAGRPVDLVGCEEGCWLCGHGWRRYPPSLCTCGLLASAAWDERRLPSCWPIVLCCASR